MESDDLDYELKNDEIEDIQQLYEEDILSSGINLRDYGCCDPVMNDMTFLTVVKEIILHSEQESLAEMDANCVPSHCGLRSYLLRAKCGTPPLRSLHWMRNDVEQQVRFENTVDYPFPARLMFCRGLRRDGVYHVCRKGTHTRDATVENKYWSEQGILFQEYMPHQPTVETNDNFQNYMVYINTQPLRSGEWRITIEIGLPDLLTPSGTIMETIHHKIIFDDCITLGADNIALSLAPTEDVDFEIDDLDSTNGDFDSQANSDL